MVAANFLVAGPDVHVACYRSVGSTLETLGELADTVLTPGGSQLEVVSSALQDASGNTGAREITVVYLDSAGAIQKTTIATNGTAAVATTPTDIRAVLQVYCSDWGSGGVAAGNISLRIVSAGGDLAQILIGHENWMPGCYTVPAGHNALFMGGDLNTGANVRTDAFLQADIDLDTGALDQGNFRTLSACSFRRVGSMRGLDIDPHNRNPIAFPALSTLRLVGNCPSGTEIISGSFHLLVYPV